MRRFQIPIFKFDLPSPRSLTDASIPLHTLLLIDTYKPTSSLMPGRLIHSVVPVKGPYQLDVGRMAKGLYSIRIKKQKHRKYTNTTTAT